MGNWAAGVDFAQLSRITPPFHSPIGTIKTSDVSSKPAFTSKQNYNLSRDVSCSISVS